MTSLPPPPRVQHQLDLLAQLRARNPRQRPAYFAHLQVEVKGRVSELLLGTVNQVGADVSVLDWQASPLAEIFLAYNEGEAYQLDLVERTLEGTVREKNVLTFSGAELTQVEGPGEAWILVPGEGWKAAARGVRPRLMARTEESRRPFRSPLEVTLDDAQQRIVALPEDRSVLILGEAGFGKTTVGLHRLIRLKQARGKRYRAAVLVPSEGLRRLTEMMLERRHVEGVDVHTYDTWARTVARRAFVDLPKRESGGASGNVSRLKRHRALRPVLEAYVRDRPRPAKDEDRPTRSKARAQRVDLEHLFGDGERMAALVAQSGGALAASSVVELRNHLRTQFTEAAENTFAHVDGDRLEALDGRRLDDGTPFEDANSVDPEDYAVLFELDRLRALARGEPPAPVSGAYDCLLLDEAQEFSPLELTLMGRALRPRGALIVAGDAAQQLDPTADFGGWDAVMADLGMPRHEKSVLEVNYRCPPEVTALAREVIAGRAAAVVDASIPVLQAPHGFALTLWLMGELERVTGEDPSASLTVICRTRPVARTLARNLSRVLPLHLALDGNFEFRPGITVTSVDEVKGLEFDYVVLPDLDEGTYPPQPEARRGLYVALTRATHRLALASVGPLTTMIKAPDS